MCDKTGRIRAARNRGHKPYTCSARAALTVPFSAAALPRRRGINSWYPGVALALLQGTAKAVRLGSGLDDIGAVGDAVDHAFAQPGVGSYLRPF
jgi:hypothetical protein